MATAWICKCFVPRPWICKKHFDKAADLSARDRHGWVWHECLFTTIRILPLCTFNCHTACACWFVVIQKMAVVAPFAPIPFSWSGSPTKYLNPGRWSYLLGLPRMDLIPMSSGTYISYGNFFLRSQGFRFSASFHLEDQTSRSLCNSLELSGICKKPPPVGELSFHHRFLAYFRCRWRTKSCRSYQLSCMLQIYTGKKKAHFFTLLIDCLICNQIERVTQTTILRIYEYLLWSTSQPFDAIRSPSLWTWFCEISPEERIVFTIEE